MSRGIFMAGTDTGVGKTLASGSILAALLARGLDAGYLKPVGTEGEEVDGRLVNPDALWIREMAGLAEHGAELNPFCLIEPLSPLAAARLEEKKLDFDRIVAESRRALGRHVATLVEGAGGLLVPLSPGTTMLDLMAGLNLPGLLVARPGLGTINHTILSLDAMRARGLALVGFCFSGAETGHGRTGTSNSELIVEYSGARFLGALPTLNETPPERMTAAQLAKLAEEHLEMDHIADALS